MRNTLTASENRTDLAWLPGLPHALAGLSPLLAFNLQACVAGLVMATLASFIVYLPVTALGLNGGRAIGPTQQAPELTVVARGSLFALWTLTAWAGAALVGLAG